MQSIISLKPKLASVFNPRLRCQLCFLGDVCYYDENERFFIVDRIKELIKYKGFQVIAHFTF